MVYYAVDDCVSVSSMFPTHHRHQEFFLCVNVRWCSQRICFRSIKSENIQSDGVQVRLKFLQQKIEFNFHRNFISLITIYIPLRCRGNIKKQMIDMCCKVMMIKTLNNFLLITSLFIKISGDRRMLKEFELLFVKNSTLMNKMFRKIIIDINYNLKSAFE